MDGVPGGPAIKLHFASGVELSGDSGATPGESNSESRDDVCSRASGMGARGSSGEVVNEVVATERAAPTSLSASFGVTQRDSGTFAVWRAKSRSHSRLGSGSAGALVDLCRLAVGVGSDE